MADFNDIILFHYTFSPYAHRITYYLQLRGIAYAECIQPVTLPRPDLTSLGIKYRRIPVLSIGRDVYTDTRLILGELEKRFPPSDKHPAISNPQTEGLSKLLEIFAVDGGVFQRAAQLLPTDLPLLSDPKFTKDREEFFGRSWAHKDINAARPEAIAHMRKIWDTYETLLQDGREWIAGTDKAALADIEGVWALDWLLGVPGGLESIYFNDKIYSKTYAWVERFRSAVKTAKKSAPKPVELKGPEASKHIYSASYSTDEKFVDDNDPLQIKEGEVVDVWPTDSGTNHRDQGKLVKISKDEVVIAVKGEQGEELHLHAPRWGFRIRPVSSANL